MVVLQVKAAAGGSDIEMVGLSGPAFARGDAGAMELVVGVVHLVDAEDGLQAVFVECLVVRHQGKARNERLDLFPDFGEDGGVGGVGGA